MIGFYLTLIDDENDKAEFERLYLDMREKLFAVSFSILKNEYGAEDAVSDAFYKIAGKFNELKHLEINQLRAYCIITVRNISYNSLKKKSFEISIDSEEITDDSFITNDALEYADHIYLKEKIGKLKYEDYELLMLFYFYRYTLREISEMKSIKYSAAKKRLHRARGHLKKLIEEDEHVKNQL